ncbi:hypothetical protein DL96DRAFT_1685633 [Flagelloscypha sp. PMI_526]|nr:hypothetical protein DL96DRAFT_1685633 [Flagelloscypha sp. PMI_526]
MFEPYRSFPAELFPQIVQHASIPDLHVYTLVNSFFQSLAQPALFSLVRMVGDVDGQLLFFETLRGAQLTKHTKTIVLGRKFYEARDQTRAFSFLRTLGQHDAKIHTLYFFNLPAWHDTPEKILAGLYTFVMPRLHTIEFSNMVNIPFTEILSHCVMLKVVKFEYCSTSDGHATNLQTLPNIQNIDLIGNYNGDLETRKSLGAYLEAKGSSIKALTLGGYLYDTKSFSIAQFANIIPHLRQLTVRPQRVRSFLHHRPLILRFDDLQELSCLHITIILSYIKWSAFLEFLDQHFEQKCFPLSLKDIHVQVIIDLHGSLGLPNLETAGSHAETSLRLPSTGDILLHVILHMSDKIGAKNSARINATIQEYDLVQRRIEPSLLQWMQAGRLIVTREV